MSFFVVNNKTMIIERLSGLYAHLISINHSCMCFLVAVGVEQ